MGTDSPQLENKQETLSMPSLSDLDTSLRGKRLIGRIMGIHGPPTLRGLQIADGYVRLVEKTVLEYEAARREFISFLREKLSDNHFRAQDHFETCIQSLHRAILYLDRLRRLGFRRPDGTAFVPRPHDLEVLTDAVRSQVRRFRDASEHLDDDIIDGRIPEEADVAIHLGWHYAKLADIEIRYQELSKWILQLHHFAVLLSKVELVVTNPVTRKSSTLSLG